MILKRVALLVSAATFGLAGLASSAIAAGDDPFQGFATLSPSNLTVLNTGSGTGLPSSGRMSHSSMPANLETGNSSGLVNLDGHQGGSGNIAMTISNVSGVSGFAINTGAHATQSVSVNSSMQLSLN